jgi:hypothetical protein
MRRQWDGGTLNLVVGTAKDSLLITMQKYSDANKPGFSLAQAAADTNTLNSAKDIRRFISSGFMDY